MDKTETKPASKGGTNSVSKKKRTISPEQLEKMRLGRMQKAKERKEQRERQLKAQKEAIQQQQERIELLKITKKKKAEIKRRLAEVKKGNTKMDEVDEIIEQYEPATVGGTPSGGKPDNVASEAGKLLRSEKLEEVGDIPEYDDFLQLEIEEIEQREAEEKAEEQERVRTMVKNIKLKEEQKQKELLDETNKYEEDYRKAVKTILDTLPDPAKKYFKDETDNFNPKLPIEQNINNMINSINKKIQDNIKTVENVKTTLEDIESKNIEPELLEHTKLLDSTKKDISLNKSLEMQKKAINIKLQNLYKLR